MPRGQVMSDTIDLSSPEAKAAIKAAVDEATEGLVAKRDELLIEVKKLKQGRQINPEDVSKLESEIDTLRSDLTAAQKMAKKATADADAAAKKLADAEGYTTKLLVDNGLNDALTKANVTNPALIKAAKAMLSSSVLVVTEGDQKIAKFGDKPLHEAISEWAGSDEGKHFVTAADVSGSGSQGGHKGGGAAQKSIKRSEFNAMNPAAQSAHFQGGGIVVD